MKYAIQKGQCECMGSPYANPMLANFPQEDGTWANEFAMRAYEKHLGFRPVSAWNPECSWRQYVPHTFRDVGYKYLTLDFESYKICNDKEYGWVERNRARDMNWGGNLPWYDLDPDDPGLHFPFKDVIPGLDGFCRSDRLTNYYIRYFLSRGCLNDFLDNIKKWSGIKKKGALLIIAEDAEYTGTTAYFYIKYHGDYSRSFEVDPDGRNKLIALVNEVKKIGEFITFEEACQLEPLKEPFFVEDTFAWHRTYADAWANTPEAKRYNPQIALLRQDYKDNVREKAGKNPKYKELAEKFWFHLTNGENSDGRWPPPPERTCPFNREWVENEIKQAKQVLAKLKKIIK